MSKSFFVADFEFTHYTKPVGKPRGFFSEIIEIGAVKIDSDSHETTGHIQSFVKPRFYPKQAMEGMAFSMITKEHMKDAIEFSDMLEKLKALYIPGETYFVAWGNADYDVIREGCERHDLTNPVLYSDYLDLAAAHKMYKGISRTSSLRDALEEQGIVTEGLWHTAYDDAVNTGKLLLKLMEGGWKLSDYFDNRPQYRPSR